jgi:transaldolase
MKFFLDTANIEEIKTVKSWVLLDGVTTNPSLVAKEKGDFIAMITEIASVTDGPVSAEVLTETAEEMIPEAEKLAKIAKNIAVKIPFTKDGMVATKYLSDKGIPVNVTLIFDPVQALIAARAGAAYVSPFVGRLDDISSDGMAMVSDIARIFDNYGFGTEIIVASVRHPLHVMQAALIGAHISTIPFSVMERLFYHPLTDIGIEKFKKDWSKKSC